MRRETLDKVLMMSCRQIRDLDSLLGPQLFICEALESQITPYPPGAPTQLPGGHPLSSRTLLPIFRGPHQESSAT